MCLDRNRLTIVCSGFGSRGRRFVPQFMIGARRLLLGYVHGGWGWVGLDGLGWNWVSDLLFSGLLQFAERTVGAFVNAVET